MSRSDITCKDDEIKVYRKPSCAKATGKSTINCAAIPTSKCRAEGGDQCTVRKMTWFCTKDTGKPGKSPTRNWMKQPGSLTKIFNDAGVAVKKGEVVKNMTAANCAQVATWMQRNVDKWREPNKNPKLEGIGKFNVLLRRTDLSADNRIRITGCKNKVKDALSALPAYTAKFPRPKAEREYNERYRGQP